VDVLSDILGTVRIAGSVLFWAEFCAPWSIRTPSPGEYAPISPAYARRMVLFHIVAEGSCFARYDGGEPIPFRAGDIVVLPYGDACIMNDEPDRTADPVPPPVPPPWVGEPPVLRYGGNGPMTTILCGFLQVDDMLVHPLLAQMPRIVRMRPSETFPRLGAIVGYALDEARSTRPGGACALNRLTEIMFVEILRQYVDEQDDDALTPLASLKDPLVGQVLALLHSDPCADWTVDSLAREAGTSRSVLAERFTHLVGYPPIAYLSRWRMQVAAHRLRETHRSTAEIAAEVGYESLSAFTRAFKRHMKETPASWRRQRQASGA
jgi:AraC family transcriptional regulator, alkane utilization regulator